MHSKDVYVMGDIHTNAVDGLWGLVKNNIRAHLMQSARISTSVLDEICFRYYRRYDVAQPTFIAFLKQISKAS